MSGDVREFYEGLAQDYHLLFADWHASVQRQGAVLERLLRGQGVAPPSRVLDCACGIGTQALGLAQRGYSVHATDLSPASVARAAREAQALGLALDVGTADLRSLERDVSGTFAAVLAFDNAVPHLLEDAELESAARGMAAKLEPGGLLMLSVRDYDALRAQRPRFTSERVCDRPEGRFITFQVWDWAEDGGSYRLQQFLLRPAVQGWEVQEHTAHYRALGRAELSRALERAGLEALRWWEPEESGFYQPVVMARRPR